MKNVLFFISLFINLSLSGAKFYVATNGTDSNPGTASQPWGTWQKGFNSITAGDTVYIRGGTYLAKSTVSHSLSCGVVADNKKGSSSKMYKVYAYPGERPVLDCRNLTSSSYERVGILLYNSDYWHLRGLEITRADQYAGTNAWGGQGLLIYNGNNNKIENISAHHNGGPGLGLRINCEGNLFLNCDSYSNYDPYAPTPGDSADGFDLGFITYRAGNERINTLIGCRAWLNGDDGYDMYQASGYRGIYYLQNCWSWKNGYRPDGVTRAGNGCGFKYGNDDSYSAGTKIMRISHNCIAYANRTRGFSQESAKVLMEFYNNIACQNQLQGFNFQEYSLADNLRNNISWQNGSSDIFNSSQTRNHNSWDSKVTVSGADFVSVDDSELDDPRKADGNLPDIGFLHLLKGSDLTDAGTDVGLPFSGTAPDLGPFELQVEPVTYPPVCLSSVIENASPSILELTFDLSLNNLIKPPVSSFIVSVNSSPVAVTSVAITANKVKLNLPADARYGDIITVSYIKPATSPLQSTAAKEAESVSNMPVVNNCKDPVIPNDPPVAIIKDPPGNFSGFTGEIDASGTYDLNNDLLTYEWIVPANVSVSSTKDPKIRYLAPVVNEARDIEFLLNVSDGFVTVSKSISVTIYPYKPEFEEAGIVKYEASDYQAIDFPKNVSDGNFDSNWSVTGDNQWLLLKLSQSFKISYLEIAFQSGQTYPSFFDIYASRDNLSWDPVLLKASSCDFSGDLQVFDFPEDPGENGYTYLKLVGHGNSTDYLNVISEFKIFGLPGGDQGEVDPVMRNITIYPNPALDYFNISIVDPLIAPDRIKLINLTGRTVYEDSVEPGIKNIQLPANIYSGIYIIELRSGNLILYAQKLLVKR